MLGLDPLQDAETEKLEPERLELEEKWLSDPWAFLTGKDIDGRPIIWTRDERDKDRPVKPFPTKMDPRGESYLKEFVKILRNEQYVLVDKARQMIITTTMMLETMHMGITIPARTMLLSKSTEDEAKQILHDKVRFPYTGLPEWFKARHPLPDKPKVQAFFPETSSYILAVGQNVAAAEAHGCTASRMIVDEAAFQPELEEIFTACLPMASQIVAVTTAEIGNPGARYFYQLLERED
jgi:hypothetical protein